jgi:aspartate ammonia-lyase
MAAQFRVETDSLGQVEVPAGVLYGAQTMRAVGNFPISGLRASPHLLRALALVKAAAAEANRDLGKLSPELANAILIAASEVASGHHDEHFVVDAFQAGAGVSLHMNMNEVLANRANQLLSGGREREALGTYDPVHPNDHVNFGQSTNDVFPTAMRLAILLAVEDLRPVLISLANSFAAKAAEFRDILKAGRTHMQDAVPITLGQEFAAYATAIRRVQRHIDGSADELRELGLGGSAVGTGLNTHPLYRERAVANLARLSEQKLYPTEDLRYAMQSCAPIAATSGALRHLALEMIRISNDLRLLSSGPATGFNEIHLPSLQPGSSIMPGKVNPVLPELTAMVAFQVVGNDTATAMAVQAGQLELNVMMPTMAHNTLQSIHILTTSLRQLDQYCVQGITANGERCSHFAQTTIALATALNPLIGYARAAALVKDSLATGRPIPDLAREQKLLSPEQLATLLDPVRMTEPR